MNRTWMFVLVCSLVVSGCSQGPKQTRTRPDRSDASTAVADASSSADAAPGASAAGGDKVAAKVDSALPTYRPAAGVSGSIKSVGSDTMNNLMTLWLEGFQKNYPSVQFEMEGKGSATAPAALIAGTAHFGPMSRPMKEDEIAKFDKEFGYPPAEVPACLDVLAVYVHKDNPIQGLTLPQVDAIFSKNRIGGHPSNITTWGDLGLTGEWANKPISLYGRNSASGTYGYFKEHALYKGDFKDSVKEQPGSSAVVQAVATDKYGIGYSGIGYITADVRAVPLAIADGETFVPAEDEYALNGEYPLARFLLLYLNHKPNETLEPLRAEFVRYVLSQQGQTDVVKDGYIPIPSSLALDTLKALGLNH